MYISSDTTVAIDIQLLECLLEVFGLLGAKFGLHLR
jgi:hypothetical protein